SVNGSQGILPLVNGVTSDSVFPFLYPTTPYAGAVATFQVVSDDGSPASDRYTGMGGDSNNGDGLFVDLTTDGTLEFTTFAASDSTAVAVDPTQPFKISFLVEGGNAMVRA